MKIVLINICLRPYMDKAYFPTGLAYVATALQNAGFSFDIIDIEAHRHTDTELEQLLKKKEYDVVAFGTLVSGYKYAKNVAMIARKVHPKATIIAGNSVASSIPEHLLRNTEVDIAVKGEGEITMVHLFTALQEGTPISTVKGISYLSDGILVDTDFEEPIQNISEIPLLNWDLFDMDIYLNKSIHDVPEPYPIPREQIKAFVVNTARGCPFRCTFCYHVFQYAKYRNRTPESILKEVEALQKKYGVNYINFFDEVTFSTKKQAREFATAVLNSNLKFYWIADIRANLFNEQDHQLLDDLKSSGCVGFGYSLESANAEILRSMNKKLCPEDFKRQMIALDHAGIKSFTSIVLGYPEETVDTIKETFDLCYELNIYPSVGYLLPQPGTPMFDIAQKKGFADDLEKYLQMMGDRQDLRFNLTAIPDDVFEKEVQNHLERIATKMKLGLDKDKLIKTHSFLLSKGDN